VTRGFCADTSEFTDLILDDAVLSPGSFQGIIAATPVISTASLVGLGFSDTNPDDLSNLLTLDTLDNVRVDQALFDRYAAEFNAFAAIASYTVTVVPSLCDVNRDGTCDVADIDLMTQTVRDGVRTLAERTELIDRSSPDGFYTFFGDANLDGEFNSGDLVQVFDAGHYEDVIEGNSGWSEGDWDGDGDFTSGDFVVAFQDGSYEVGPRGPVAAVPEPSGVLFVAPVLITFSVVSRTRRKRV
jgi:hypothetical protein